MILKFKDLDTETTKALKSLGNKVKIFSSKELYNLIKSIKAIEEKVIIFNQLRDNLILEYCEKGEDNKPIMLENNTYEVKDKATFNKKIIEILETIEDIEVELPILKVDELKEYELTTEELIILDNLGIIEE